MSGSRCCIEASANWARVLHGSMLMATGMKTCSSPAEGRPVFPPAGFPPRPTVNHPRRGRPDRPADLLGEGVPRRWQRQGLAWRAAVEKQPMISNDVQADAQTIMKAQCMERGINSLAMLPLVVAGEGIGVLALYAGEIGFFDDQEMKLLVELASGRADALSGRFLHALDDLDDLLRRSDEIARDDLYALRFRRRSAAPGY